MARSVKLLLCSLFLVVVFASGATAQAVKIHLRGGGVATFPVADIQKLTFAGVTGTGVEGEISPNLGRVLTSFVLLQNYPNPFNPTTTIQYEIPEGGAVDISIVDLSGRLVRHTQTDHGQGGVHSFVWNGRTDAGQPVAAGAYLCAVRFGTSILTRKMLLLK